MAKAIFLDIDGVLNSNCWNDSHLKEIRKAKKFSLVKAEEILLWLSLHHDATKWVVLDNFDLRAAAAIPMVDCSFKNSPTKLSGDTCTSRNRTPIYVMQKRSRFRIPVMISVYRDIEFSTENVHGLRHGRRK